MTSPLLCSPNHKPDTYYPQVMRVLHVTHSISSGGAAIAARRIFEATRTQPGIDAHLIVTSPLPAGLSDPHITYFQPKNQRLNIKTEAAALRLQKSVNPIHRTIGLFPSGLADHILQGNWDLIHLHWVGLGTLSIREIGQISSTIPTVWTLHDSWPFCGADHHPYFENDDRFIASYTPQSRLPQDSRYDLDAAGFRFKQRHWRSPITLIAPSTFMADNAKASALARDWPITTIPHPIDPKTFHPKGEDQRVTTLTAAGLDPTKPVVLFVSSPGSDFNKGLDLLETAFKEIERRRPDAQLTTIGGPWPRLGLTTRQIANQSSENQLANWYSAADVVLVPSRLESFSLVAAEAQACGTPVIAFNTSGLIDVLAGQPKDTLISTWDATRMGSKAVKLLESGTSDQLDPTNTWTGKWNPDIVGAAYVGHYEHARGSYGAVTSRSSHDA